MKYLFSINTEGGPLLFLDAGDAKEWKGAEEGSTDYDNLCAVFGRTSEVAGFVIAVGGRSAIAWEMSGAGTADVFREDTTGIIRIVRAWVQEDTPKELMSLASFESSSGQDIGEFEIISGVIERAGHCGNDGTACARCRGTTPSNIYLWQGS